VESLSAYARQFLERMEKPDVDEISGIAPRGDPAEELDAESALDGGNFHGNLRLFAAAFRALRADFLYQVRQRSAPRFAGRDCQSRAVAAARAAILCVVSVAHAHGRAEHRGKTDIAKEAGAPDARSAEVNPGRAAEAGFNRCIRMAAYMNFLRRKLCWT